VTPYLSLVVTARNDDHGGNLLRRMQAFVNAFIQQAKKHGLVSELVIVEWNPPEGRPGLMDVLQWPAMLGPVSVRFIEVPGHVHRRYRYSEALPLYQMIAKNAGIRRAQGRFILATNIDIILSEELIEYLAGERLKAGSMYRIDRHDVTCDVPVDASVEEQLAYCRDHVIRVNAREGTFRTTAEGRALEVRDIAPPDSGIVFGAGWFAVESGPEGPYRCVENDAEVSFTAPSNPPPPLIFDLEPTFGAGGESLELQVVTGDNAGPCSALVKGRSSVKVQLGTGCRSFRFHVIGGGHASPHDPRMINFRVLRCEWGRHAAWDMESDSAHASGIIQVRPAETIEVRSASIPTKTLGFIAKLRNLAARIADGGPVVQVWVPVNSLMRRMARIIAKPAAAASVAPPKPGAIATAPAETPMPPLFLHTNACGDFTLMAREDWFNMRAYPEFDLYSMNIDSVLCYAAHHAGIHEKMLLEPMRIYHIEHGAGSGWTPEGQARLFERLTARGVPWLDYQELVALAAQMRRFGSTMIFNREDWGLANEQLSEITLPSTVSTSS
jgi:hypothetical protein